MSTRDATPHYYIGWDVGGWNCDSNPRSKDAIVILNSRLAVFGTAWRGNLREAITASKTSRCWLRALFKKCGEAFPDGSPQITLAIDAPLGFSDEFLRLASRKGHFEASEKSGNNRYLFRQTERELFNDGLTPLSAVKDMIGSQATKGMHVLAKFAWKTEGCGVWTDGDSLRVIETYPAACRGRMPPPASLKGLRSLGDGDKNDARICALMAYLFEKHRRQLKEPSPDVSRSEGWIWVPKPRKKKPA